MQVTTDKEVARLFVIAVKKGIIAPRLLEDLLDTLDAMRREFASEAAEKGGRAIVGNRACLAERLYQQIEEEGHNNRIEGF